MAESLVKEWYRGDFGNLTTIFDDLIYALDNIRDIADELNLVAAEIENGERLKAQLSDAAQQVTSLIDEVYWLEQSKDEAESDQSSLEYLVEEREAELEDARNAEDYARRLEQILYDFYLPETAEAEGFWSMLDGAAREAGYTRTDVAHNQRPLGVGAE